MIIKPHWNKHSIIFKEGDISKYSDDKSIYIEDFFNTKVDLSLFENIEYLYGYYNQMKNLDKADTLEYLSILGYKDVRKEISKLLKLQGLVLTKCNVINLAFLNSLKKLERIELNYFRRLTDISDLANISATLKELEIRSCKKINNLEKTLIKLKNLHSLKLLNCKLESLDWIKELPNLKNFVFMDSNVVSGDISPAAHIEYVAIDNKRHYNYKFDQDLKKIVPKKS